MGVRRAVQRRKEKELRRTLQEHFVPSKAEGKITCGQCGRTFPVAVPMVPKPGAELAFRSTCVCGNQISVTLTGRTEPDPAREGGTTAG